MILHPQFRDSRAAVEVYLAGRDVERTGAQVYSLPLVNEGQHKHNTRTLGRTHSTQTENYYPLVVGHRLWTEWVTVCGLYQQVSGQAV